MMWERSNHMTDDINMEADRNKKAYDLWPVGHYYSPIPDIDEVRKNEEAIFSLPETIPGIDLNAAGQDQLFDSLARYYPDVPFTEEKTDCMRYYYKNDFYSYGDAVILFCIIRHLKPRRIIEVGSGFSSCVILDTNERFFNNSVSCTFIEPYPDRLLSVIKENDLRSTNLLKNKVQDVDINVFNELSRRDILFIDDSHVSKVNSDVNYIIFNVLPNLKPGVFVHFHDIFYPFEYPKEWIYEGKFWNEAYLLKAFLQYNDAFKIEYFSSYFFRKFFEKANHSMPLLSKNPGGNIWISRTG